MTPCRDTTGVVGAPAVLLGAVRHPCQTGLLEPPRVPSRISDEGGQVAYVPDGTGSILVVAWIDATRLRPQ